MLNEIFWSKDIFIILRINGRCFTVLKTRVPTSVEVVLPGICCLSQSGFNFERLDSSLVDLSPIADIISIMPSSILLDALDSC